MASISLAKGLRRSNARLMAQQEIEQAHRKIALKDRLRRHGLAGQRLGKHKVPERQIEVQLGEDLTENLRGLKVNRIFFPLNNTRWLFWQPEGNLFKDRFLSLQERALIEPRVPVLYVSFFAPIFSLLINHMQTPKTEGATYWVREACLEAVWIDLSNIVLGIHETLSSSWESSLVVTWWTSMTNM